MRQHVPKTQSNTRNITTTASKHRACARVSAASVNSVIPELPMLPVGDPGLGVVDGVGGPKPDMITAPMP